MIAFATTFGLASKSSLKNSELAGRQSENSSVWGGQF
jgi:hypothetical protein